MTYSGTSVRYFCGTALKSWVENTGLVARSVNCRAVDDVPDLAAGDVGLEEGLDGRDGLGLCGLGVGDELGEFLFQQLVLRFEGWDEAEDLFQDFAQGQAAVHGRGFAQLVEGVVFLGFVEDLAVDVVDDAIPLPCLDGFRDGRVFAHGVLEFLEEHPVDLHPLEADGLFLDRGEDVRAQVLVGAASPPPGPCLRRHSGPLPWGRGSFSTSS